MVIPCGFVAQGSAGLQLIKSAFLNVTIKVVSLNSLWFSTSECFYYISNTLHRIFFTTYTIYLLSVLLLNVCSLLLYAKVN